MGLKRETKKREKLPALEELQWHGRVRGQAGERRGGVYSLPGDPGSLRDGGRSGGPSGRISKGDSAREGCVQTCDCEVPEVEDHCRGVGPEQGKGSG